MAYQVPPGLLNGAGGFAGAFGNALGAYGQMGVQQQQSRDAEMDRMLQIARMEGTLREQEFAKQQYLKEQAEAEEEQGVKR